jgi:hypothetical protein
MTPFDSIIDSIDGSKIAARFNFLGDSAIVTIGIVGPLHLQTRFVWDLSPTVEDNSPQEQYPHLWQAIAVEVAIVVNGEVVAKNYKLGIWAYLGSESDPEWDTFTDELYTAVKQLTQDVSDRAVFGITKSMEAMKSAARVYTHGADMPEFHTSVCI